MEKLTFFRRPNRCARLSHRRRALTRATARRPLRIEALEDRRLLAVLTDPMLAGAVTHEEAKVFLRTDVAADVAIEFSTSPSFNAPATSSIVSTEASGDFTGIVTLSGLDPDTEYFYRPLIDGAVPVDAPVNSFTSFPVPGTSQEFSFAITADIVRFFNGQNDIPAPAYAAIEAEDPAFMIQAGDFDHSNPSTLAEKRNLSRILRNDESAAGADFAEHIAPSIPFFHVWDDHDYGNCGNGDKTCPERDDALQAFDEYYPTPERPNPAGIWHSFTYGNAEFFMLDARSQRDPVSDPAGPDKSMLDGDQIPDGQLDWFFDGLRDSTATWKFVISSVPFNSGTKPWDAWAAYPDERQTIVDFIEDEGISDVVFISADIHSGGALNDGTNDEFPEISVPHTNINTPDVCTCGQRVIIGDWTHGFVSGAEGGGYAMITVSGSEILAETKADDGSLRLSMTLQSVDSVPGPPQVVDTSLDGSTWSSEFRENLENVGLGSQGYSIPVGSLAQALTAPWRDIDRIVIRFSENVTVEQNDLMLRGNAVPDYAFLPEATGGFEYNSATSTATWKLAAPIAGDKLLIQLSDDIADLDGNALDGEWMNITDVYPSGDDQAGGDFLFRFNVLPGDVNGNGTVDSPDYTIWSNKFSNSASALALRANLNADASVGGPDYTIWSNEFAATLPVGNPSPAAPAGSASPPIAFSESADSSSARAETIAGRDGSGLSSSGDDSTTGQAIAAGARPLGMLESGIAADVSRPAANRAAGPSIRRIAPSEDAVRNGSETLPSVSRRADAVERLLSDAENPILDFYQTHRAAPGHHPVEAAWKLKLLDGIFANWGQE